MVNYCCVEGCGRNSRQNKHLNFYSLPKEQERQIQWLEAAHRPDLIKKVSTKLSASYRFCSRHFELASVKNRNLIPDALPTLCLPGGDDEDCEDPKPILHTGIVCDRCKEEIAGFRYKCVTCVDYDLCTKCEMHETHPNHFMLRISRPLKFKKVDELVQNWRRFFKFEHVTLSDCESNKDIGTFRSKKPNTSDSDSSDDEPITKYVSEKRTDSSDLVPEEIKKRIRQEVLRVINLNNASNGGDGGKTKGSNKEAVPKSRKKKATLELEREAKRNKIEIDIEVKEDIGPEVAFADVNDIGNNETSYAKNEVLHISMERGAV